MEEALVFILLYFSFPHICISVNITIKHLSLGYGSLCYVLLREPEEIIEPVETSDPNETSDICEPCEQARKLQATLEGCNPKLSLARLRTGVKCRATSVAKNPSTE